MTPTASRTTGDRGGRGGDREQPHQQEAPAHGFAVPHMGLPPLGREAAEVKALLAPLRNVTIALYAADNAFAVGAIIRVAHSFLAREIVLIGMRRITRRRRWAWRGTSRWCESQVTTRSSRTSATAALGHREGSRDHEHPRRAEVPARRGAPFRQRALRHARRAHRRAEAVIGIPIYGVNHSLPLAVAAGIVMNEWARREVLGRRDGAVAGLQRTLKPPASASIEGEELPQLRGARAHREGCFAETTCPVRPETATKDPRLSGGASPS